MSLTGFHPLWAKTLSRNLQAVADQSCHVDASFPDEGTAYRGVYCTKVLILATPLNKGGGFRFIIKFSGLAKADPPYTG
jgi:hypothetical protein